MINRYLKYISVAVSFSIFLSCASTPQPIPNYNLQKKDYTSTYPAVEISKKLSRIQNSIERIIATARYKVWYFGDRNVTLNDIKEEALDSLAIASIYTEQGNAGTGISILANDNYTLFITAYHVTANSDTVITYKTKGFKRGKYIKSIAVKQSSQTYLFDGTMLVQLQRIAVNPGDDLALLVGNRNYYNYYAPSLSIRTGAAKNLQLGSVIYVLGYPLGSPMVTAGMVSAPNFDGQGSFLTDALFNHGISGGIIIASNNHYKNFDWVGMVTTASVKRISFLVPNPDYKFYTDFELYSDSIFVDRKSFINYGLSRAVPIEEILNFIYSNEDKLNKYGLSATNLAGQ